MGGIKEAGGYGGNATPGYIQTKEERDDLANPTPKTGTSIFKKEFVTKSI